jgi:hypothetical protein
MGGESMANFLSVTASNGAEVKEDKIQELKKYLSTFATNGEDGDMVQIEETPFKIYIYGYDWFQAHRYNEDSVNEEIDFDTEVTEEFLIGLAEFLKEPLIVQYIGHEKCRFPLAAWEYKVYPNGKLEHNGFKLI